MNPTWHQKKLREYCEAKSIIITAFSPLGAKGTVWGSNEVMDSEYMFLRHKLRLFLLTWVVIYDFTGTKFRDFEYYTTTPKESVNHDADFEDLYRYDNDGFGELLKLLLIFCRKFKLVLLCIEL